MFTGIVEELGSVRAVRTRGLGARLEINAGIVLEDVGLGDSIAVNGCCLTVVEIGEGWWAADAVPETLDRTNLGSLKPGDPLNLERPVRLVDRLGGHMVQGHVDAVGILEGRTAAGGDGSAVLRIQAPRSVLRHVVEKGSVTVDGVSLTVMAVDDEGFEVALIPHTLAVTTLGRRAPGDSVNLESDILAKYVERLIQVTRQADDLKDARNR